MITFYHQTKITISFWCIISKITVSSLEYMQLSKVPKSYLKQSSIIPIKASHLT